MKRSQKRNATLDLAMEHVTKVLTDLPARAHAIATTQLSAAPWHRKRADEAVRALENLAAGDAEDVARDLLYLVREDSLSSLVNAAMSAGDVPGTFSTPLAGALAGILFSRIDAAGEPSVKEVTATDGAPTVGMSIMHSGFRVDIILSSRRLEVYALSVDPSDGYDFTEGCWKYYEGNHPWSQIEESIRQVVHAALTISKLNSRERSLMDICVYDDTFWRFRVEGMEYVYTPGEPVGIAGTDAELDPHREELLWVQLEIETGTDVRQSIKAATQEAERILDV